MDVKTFLDEQGQSIIEFIFMMPVLLGLFTLMYRFNSAIQISIVNQRYQRAHLLSTNFNSPVYPQRTLIHQRFASNEHKTNQFIMGVSENTWSTNEDGEESDGVAVVMKQMIARSKNKMGPDPENEEPERRGRVRIRSTIAMCTQSNVVGGTGKLAIRTPAALKEGFQSNAFYYCGGPLNE